MKVLFISYDGMTDPLGQSQVIPYLIGLSEKGHQISLLSFEKDIVFMKRRKNIESLLEEHNIQWIPLKYHKFPRIISTIYDIWKLHRVMFQLHQKNDFHVVHCRSYISALAGLALKRKKNVSFVFDMRGFWADERVDGGLWNLKKPMFKLIYGFFKRKEKAFLTESNAIISLTESGAEEMRKWGIPKINSKIHVIPCCADFETFSLTSEIQKIESRNTLGISKECIVLSYLGSVGTWYMLDEMLSFFLQLKKKNCLAHFLIINKSDHTYILSAIKHLGIGTDSFTLISSEREMVNHYLDASDYGISFISPLFSKKSSSPTKLGEYLAKGIPVICNKNVGDVESIIQKTNGGHVIDRFDETTFDTLIEKMTFSPKVSSSFIRISASKYYDLQLGVEKYDNVYTML